VADSQYSGLRIAVIGVGLMGGSLGLAARAHAGVHHVTGYSRTEASLRLALERGAITQACGSLDEACAEADLVFVATPVRLLHEHVAAALAAAPSHAVVSDMGSTKASLMAGLSEDDQRRVVGGHPLCGSETAGVANATASLYDGATYFLTPGAHVEPGSLELLFGFLHQIGARPIAIDPREHDRLMALVSHLPHVLANTLMTQAGEHHGSRDALLSAGPSFRDLTRIAGSNPRVWTDIFLENRDSLLTALSAYRSGLEEMEAALRASDEDRIAAIIGRSREHRGRMLASGDLVAENLFRLTVHIADRPGVLRDIFLALGDAAINVEDFVMHHMSADLGGSLSVYVLGERARAKATRVLTGLGYEPVAGREAE
jgi:prephenate dehydrogenase